MTSNLTGLINLDKPTGITSAKALYKVRAVNKQRKSGHAGTLDPGASGVLILCLGKATKMVESLMDLPKIYRATARLDVTSESFDSDRPLIPVDVAEPPAADELTETLRSFEGVIDQVPPNISAIKVGGVPAYKRAARNQVLKLEPRSVHIYWMHLHRYEYPEIEFEMCCGRGTYVRSVIRDVGRQLGTGGCLTSLIRSRIGPFCVDDGWTIDAVTAAKSSSDYVIDIEEAQQRISDASGTVPPHPATLQTTEADARKAGP